MPQVSTIPGASSGKLLSQPTSTQLVHLGQQVASSGSGAAAVSMSADPACVKLDPELVRGGSIKAEPEWCELASCVKEEPPYSETTGAVSGGSEASMLAGVSEAAMLAGVSEAAMLAGGSEAAVLAGVSEAAMLAGLYDDHVVKDELVLGPERLHRPCVGSTLQVAPEICAGAELSVTARARSHLAAACAARLERLRECRTPPRRSRTTTSKNTYSCDMCTQQFKTKSVLIRHIKAHYRCEPYKEMVMTSSCLTPHERLCSRNKRLNTGTILAETTTLTNRCSYCDYKCNQKSGLLRHQRIHTGEKPFKCGYFDYKSGFKSIIQTHQKIHTGEKPFQCGNCEYRCNQKSGLLRHQRIHTGEKPFKCGYCDYKCNEKSSLRRHQRKHTGEKPFKCGYCEYKSVEKSHIQTHQKIHTGEKPFKCGYCDYTCSVKSSLRRHHRIHTGEKPFKCGYCDYKSGDKSHVLTHQKIHTGEKPFKCGYCDYTCSVKASLRRHHRIHTGEKPFKCGYCDYTCSVKFSLRSHMKHKHTGDKLM